MNGDSNSSPQEEDKTVSFSRLKSVRSKPQSFAGWKESVKKMCTSEDIRGLETGHKLWKVRKKPLLGITWHQRTFHLNFSDLCIHYGSDKIIDIANITEVRCGFSTDTLNNVEKKVQRQKKMKISELTADHCFSIIFDPKFSGLKAIRNILFHDFNGLLSMDCVSDFE